jgi:hypothetical protein
VGNTADPVAGRRLFLNAKIPTPSTRPRERSQTPWRHPERSRLSGEERDLQHKRFREAHDFGKGTTSVVPLSPLKKGGASAQALPAPPLTFAWERSLTRWRHPERSRLSGEVRDLTQKGFGKGTTSVVPLSPLRKAALQRSDGHRASAN